MTACSDAKNNQLIPQLDQHSQAVVHGLTVTGDEHLATTMLAYDVAEHYNENAASAYGDYLLFCSSTLITPNYVLTAAHCICNNDPVPVSLERTREGVHVYVAQSEVDVRQKYEIEAFYPHPGYRCDVSPTTLLHDIALLKLKESVPLSVVKPIAPLPPSLQITAEEVDSEDGVTVVDVGFGITHDEEDGIHSDKHKMTSQLYAYCPANAPVSQHCDETITDIDESLGIPLPSEFTPDIGFMYTRMGYGSHSSTCSGDSGGSTYLTRNNIPYVAAVHSHVSSYACSEGTLNGDTIVSEYYDDFIRGIVTDLPSDTPETNCNNQEDDNHDGRTDCEDPWCFHLPVCTPEKCDDNIDNDENGFIDCKDAACANAPECQKETCDDDIDNNQNGLKDCEDPACHDDPHCQVEICNDGIDNNNDGKRDCEDPVCAADALNCQPEDCHDHNDNNGNGLRDCDDPFCANETHCLEEICDDDTDNNGDGFKDCEDPLCKERYICNPYEPTGPITHKESGCSSTLHHPATSSIWLWLLGIISLVALRIRRNEH